MTWVVEWRTFMIHHYLVQYMYTYMTLYSTILQASRGRYPQRSLPTRGWYNTRYPLRPIQQASTLVIMYVGGSLPGEGGMGKRRYGTKPRQFNT